VKFRLVLSVQFTIESTADGSNISAQLVGCCCTGWIRKCRLSTVYTVHMKHKKCCPTRGRCPSLWGMHAVRNVSYCRSLTVLGVT